MSSLLSPGFCGFYSGFYSNLLHSIGSICVWTIIPLLFLYLFPKWQNFGLIQIKSNKFCRWQNRSDPKQEGHDGPGSLTWVIFPTNEFYIFVPLVPNCDPRGGASVDPKGHHVNKIDKGLQGDATYQKSKLYLFQFQRRRILKLVFFVPIFQLVTPGVGSVLTPKESYE